MSMCQNESSCVACCGTLNLRLSLHALQDLLNDRSKEISDVTADHQTLVSYRNRREEIESTIPRYDAEVYVCPFVGWIGPGRAGCLIHPIRTGRENSQNASFYGTTICQSYDCRCKEKEEKHNSGWQAFALTISEGNAMIYSRIIGDAMFYRLMEAMGPLQTLISGSAPVITKLMKLRLDQDCGPTSFELPGQSRPTVEDLLPVLFRESDRAAALKIIAEAIDAAGES